MAATFGALLSVIGRRPAAVQDRFPGVLMKALFAELRAPIAPVHVALAAALFGHRRNAAEATQAGRASVALALRSHARQQPRRQHRAGAGQGRKNLPVGMLAENFGDLPVELFESLAQQLEFL